VDLQNFPELSAVKLTSTGLRVEGKLRSLVHGRFRIELFKNSSCHPDTWHGEGEEFLGSSLISTDGKGEASFVFVRPNVSLLFGDFITATATGDGSNNTSEFSKCRGLLNIDGVEFTQVTQTIESVSDLQARG